MTLRSHRAGDLILKTYDDTDHLPSTERSAGGRTHPATPNLHPSRPGHAVPDIGVKRIVSHRENAANKQASGLRRATSIFRDSPAQTTVNRPISRRPGLAIKTSAINA